MQTADEIEKEIAELVAAEEAAKAETKGLSGFLFNLLVASNRQRANTAKPSRAK